MSDAPAVVVPVVASKAPAKQKKKAVAKKAPDHPTYNVMATAAIKSLKERSGSSRHAILKYIMDNFKVNDQAKVNSRLKLALKAGVESKTFKQVKGTGAAGSFRLGESTAPKPAAKKTAKKVVKPKSATPKKVTKKSPAKKAAAKKSAVAKKPAAKKSTAAKKPAAKKPAAKRPTPKKSAKSPAKRSTPKAKKPAAKK